MVDYRAIRNGIKSAKIVTRGCIREGVLDTMDSVMVQLG